MINLQDEKISEVILTYKVIKYLLGEIEKKDE